MKMKYIKLKMSNVSILTIYKNHLKQKLIILYKSNSQYEDRTLRRSDHNEFGRNKTMTDLLV